jgi:hypothetical protein
MSKFAGLRIASKGERSNDGAGKCTCRTSKVAVRATAAVETVQKTDNAVAVEPAGTEEAP